MPIVIRGGQVLDSDSLTFARADVVIEGSRIQAVGPAAEAPPDAGARVIDASGYLVVPGLINAHTHGDNNLGKATGDNWTLEDLISFAPALSGYLTPREQYVAAALGAIEMLKTGCTAAYDMFVAFPAPTEDGIDAVFQAYTDVGLRAVVSPLVADIVFYRTVPGLLELLPPHLRGAVERIEASPTAGLLEMKERGIRQWHGSADGRIQAALAPTIPGQCTEEFLTGCRDLARQHGVGIQVHLSETKIQVVHALRRWGRTPTARLADLDLLGPHFLGAHGVWLTPEDIEQLVQAGANIAHNPASNLKLGSGIAPVREMLDAGLNVGLGSDGSLSADNQNLFESMRFAASVGKVRHAHDPERWISARDAFRAATLGSARALGLADEIGAIAPGRKADLVLLRADSVYLTPFNDPINHFVYTETGASVDTVLVDGKVVVEGGRVLTVDEGALVREAARAMERIRGHNQALWALAEELTPYLRAACRAAAREPLPTPVNRHAAHDSQPVL